MEKTNVWLDTDPGIDDTMAIILACFNEKINLLGISTVAGNTTVDNTTINVLKILEMCGIRNIDVVKGSSCPLINNLLLAQNVHGNDGLGEIDLPFPKQSFIKENPIFYIYNKIKSQEKKTTIIAIGPQTNIALLLKCFPDIKEKISQILFMGGSIGMGNITPAAEFNIYNDPEAAHIVLESGIDLVMNPLELPDKYPLPIDIDNKIKNMNSKISDNLYILLKKFRIFLTKLGFHEANIYDLFSVYYVISKEDFVTQKIRVEVELKAEKSKGRTLCDIYKFSKDIPNVELCMDVNISKVWDAFLNAISKAIKNTQ